MEEKNQRKKIKEKNGKKKSFAYVSSFGSVLLLFAYFFVLLWFRLPLFLPKEEKKSRDKEKKGNKLPFGDEKKTKEETTKENKKTSFATNLK